MTTNKNAVTATTSQNVTPINKYDKKVMCNIAELFPDVFDTDDERTFPVRAERHPLCQKPKAGYIPDKALLEKILMWWKFAEPTAKFPEGRPLKPFGLHGHTGTGKTDMWLYIADALNEPVCIVKCTAETTADQLEGDRELICDANGNSQTVHNYSDMVNGYENGYFIIFEEVDKLDIAAQAAIFPVTERKPLTLNVFKKTINCHPHTRMAASANTTGEGGSELYSSSQIMDAALRARFGWCHVGFLEPQHETLILKNSFPQLPSTFRLKMINTANGFRDALSGPDRDDKIDDPIGCVFSTRVLVQWAEMIMCFGKAMSAMESLEFSFWGSVNAEDEDKARDIIHLIWADDINKPIGELMQSANGKK